MAFTGNFLCTSFKTAALRAQHDFTASTGHTFKLAMYDNNASFTAATTDYTATNEITGTGYSAGGGQLTQVTPTSSGTTSYVDFDDLTFSSATLSGVRGAMQYNTTTGGGTGTTDAITILDFGSDQAVSGGNFTIVFPVADSSSAIIRFA